MHKKHMFLRVFSKITIFACVFCAFSAWAETTTCDINYTPVTGNSIQNGTPTPTNPVAIESVGTKVGNKYQIPVVAQGKNLFDVSKYNSSSDWIGVNYKYVEIPLPNGTYTIHWDITTASSNGVYWLLQVDGNQKGTSGPGTGGAWLYHSDLSSLQKDTFTFTVTEGRVYLTCSFSAYFDTFKNMLATVQIEQGSTATSYAPYSEPTTTPIYLNAPLRKVGDYADVLDYKKGQIIRNVGVKVLDGTENWKFASSTDFHWDEGPDNIQKRAVIISNFYKYGTTGNFTISGGDAWKLQLRDSRFTTLNEFLNWLASEYANGTPVTAYYPLATPVVEQIENWSCTPPITDIKIATTKFVDEEFKAAEAKLATTVQTIESVVSRTIAQTGQIQILQDTKQTRPDESCPANMKCLLVQDEDGTPHWYPIIEP